MSKGNSKDRQHNDQKMKKNSWSIVPYTENGRLSNTKPTQNVMNSGAPED
jgi:hypothetical protein